MNSLKLIVALMLVTGSVMGQSTSYQILKDKFRDQPNVESFSCSGWLGRLVFKMAGEPEFYKAIQDLNHVRVMSIPTEEFATQRLTVNGFRRVLRNDSFEELAVVRDQGEVVSIYLREGKNNRNTYFVLVEEEDEVVAIELSGYIDPTLLNPDKTTISYNR